MFKKAQFIAIFVAAIISLPIGLSTALAWSGKVIDGQTGKPIEGASVLIYSTRSVFAIVESKSELIKVVLICSDKDGRYHIPSTLPIAGLLSRLRSTNVIIYQPGYQAYIVTIWHDSPYAKPDPNFKDEDNIVKLDRIPPNFSHKKHYEDIDHALWGIDDYPYVYPYDDWMTWNKLLDINLKAIPDKEEFLRRVNSREVFGTTPITELVILKQNSLYSLGFQAIILLRFGRNDE